MKYLGVKRHYVYNLKTLQKIKKIFKTKKKTMISRC